MHYVYESPQKVRSTQPCVCVCVETEKQKTSVEPAEVNLLELVRIWCKCNVFSASLY